MLAEQLRQPHRALSQPEAVVVDGFGLCPRLQRAHPLADGADLGTMERELAPDVVRLQSAVSSTLASEAPQRKRGLAPGLTSANREAAQEPSGAGGRCCCGTGSCRVSGLVDAGVAARVCKCGPKRARRAQLTTTRTDIDLGGSRTMHTTRPVMLTGFLALALSACVAPPTVFGPDDTEARTGTRARWPATEGAMNPTTELNVVANTAQWAQFEIAIASARVTQSRDGALLLLDIAVSNLSSQAGRLDPSHWRVEMPHAEGSSRTSRIDVAGDATLDATVEFLLSDSPRDLTGAVLVIDGPKASALEPETVPLDIAWQSAYPLPIESLRGHRIDGTRTPGVHDEVADFEVLDARIDINDVDERGRASLGKRYLRVDFRVTAVETEFGNLVTRDENYRLHVDGRKYPPLNSFVELLDTDEALETFMLFEVAGSAHQVELTFATNDATSLVPIDLPELPAL